MNEFKEILRDLLNGNVSEAEALTETYSDEDNILALWEQEEVGRLSYIINIVPNLGHINY